MGDQPTPERLPALFPREHGASMELLFALLTAFCLARPTPSAVAIGCSAVLVFVAHESFMVLIGRRGARRQVAQRTVARRTMLALAVPAAGLAVYGALGMSRIALAALAAPIVLSAPAVALALKGHERSLAAELFVVAALTALVLPVSLASDAALGDAVRAAAIWFVCFVVGTLAARGVLYRAKDQGRGLKLSLAAALIVATLSIGSAALGWLPVRLALALLPCTLVAILITTRPPSPKKMVSLGLGLTAASAVTFGLIAS